MKTFLIDLENVKNQGLVGVELLAPEDRVFIFYSESANSLSIPIIQAMNNSRAQIEYVRLQRSGRNAMDFQIVALLGFLIGSERKGLYCIVSQDNGYLAPVEFFMDHAADQLDVNVLLASSIQKGIRKWGPVALAAPALTETPEVVLVAEEHKETQPEAEEEKEKSTLRNKVRNIRRPKRAKREEKEETAPETESKAGRKPKTQPKQEEGEKPAEKIEEKPESQVVEEPVAEPAAPAAEPVKTTETKTASKRRGRPRKDASASQPKQEKKKEYKQVEVPQEFLERVHGIVEGHLDEEQKKYDKVVAQAILSTKAKNEFYQFFRRTLGVQKGGDLYRAVRGDYEKLKAAAAVNRQEDGAAE